MTIYTISAYDVKRHITVEYQTKGYSDASQLKKLFDEDSTFVNVKLTRTTEETNYVK